MNYTSLVAGKSTAGSIMRWVNNDSIDATVILEEAQAWIYHRMRVRQMIASTPYTGAMVVGQDYISLPDRFLAAFTLHITGINYAKLERKLLEEIEDLLAFDGSGNRVNQKPRFYHLTASRVEFDSPSDQTYPFRMRYFERPALLAADNLTNFLTDEYPKLLRCACLGMANEFLKDEAEKAYWLELAMAEIANANEESDAERSGTLMAVEVQ